MKFTKIIQAMGLNPINYPVFQGLYVTLLDRKGRILVKEDDFLFRTPLTFASKQDLVAFCELLHDFNPETDKIAEVVLEDSLLIIKKPYQPLFLHLRQNRSDNLAILK